MLVIVGLARRNWKMALGAVLSITAQIITATLLFGSDSWTNFEPILPLARAVLEEGLVCFGKMQSVFAAVRLIGRFGVLCASSSRGRSRDSLLADLGQ
jgi:alpha-1,2-mannosyltransferase